MLKHNLIGTACALALMLGAPVVGAPAMVSAAQAQAQVSFNIFFDRLAPNGVWVKSDRYDYVWCPSVDSDWMPYSRGHWIYLADRGWYFDSDEPFAWAVYHYGRWYRDTNIGWCWVPGDVWSPAWVTWRRGNDYLGWAPIQPEGQGYAVGTSIAAADVPHEDWVFVPSRQFLAPQLSATLIIGNRQPDVFNRTQTVGPVVVQNNIVINNVINVQFVEQQTGTKVQQVKAQTADQPQTTTVVTNNSIAVFNPTLQKPAPTEAPKAAVAANDAKAKLKAIPPAPADSGQGNAANGNAAQTPPAGNPPAPASTGNTPPATPGTGNAGAATPTDQTTKPAGGTANGKPTTCPANEDLVNGKCVPAKPGQGGTPGTSTATPATATPATAGAATAGAPETATGDQPAKGDNQKPTHAKPNTGKPAANDAPTCAPSETLQNGKCVPAKGPSGNDHKPAGNAAGAMSPDTQTQTGGQKPQAGAAPSSGPASGSEAGKPGSSKPGKPQTCPPGEELVHGACQPATKAGPGNQPAQ